MAVKMQKVELLLIFKKCTQLIETVLSLINGLIFINSQHNTMASYQTTTVQ